MPFWDGSDITLHSYFKIRRQVVTDSKNLTTTKWKGNKKKENVRTFGVKIRFSLGLKLQKFMKTNVLKSEKMTQIKLEKIWRAFKEFFRTASETFFRTALWALLVVCFTGNKTGLLPVSRPVELVHYLMQIEQQITGLA